jgi:carbon storage regulator
VTVLVLQRYRDESIVLTIPEDLPPGTRLTVTVVDIRGDKVRLGVTAPIEVKVHRHEVQEIIDHEAEEAGRWRP